MRKSFLLALALTFGATATQAQVITPGFTYAVASNPSACATGTHYHSNTGGAFGNPAGKAEVGNYTTECVRGLSEYNLTGLTVSPSAFVTFDVFKMGGLFAGVNDSPFSGSINVFAYQGNNLENIGDYSALRLDILGSFSTAGLVVGDILSFDVTEIFNAFVTDGNTSLGIRLERAGESPANQGAVTFDTFRLTSNDLTTTVTPEPGTYLLLATGLAGVAFLARRRRHSA
jgi:hypothetical protein